MKTIISSKHYTDEELFVIIPNDEFESNIGAFNNFKMSLFYRNNYTAISEYEKEDGDDFQPHGRRIA